MLDPSFVSRRSFFANKVCLTCFLAGRARLYRIWERDKTLPVSSRSLTMIALIIPLRSRLLLAPDPQPDTITLAMEFGNEVL